MEDNLLFFSLVAALIIVAIVFAFALYSEKSPEAYSEAYLDMGAIPKEAVAGSSFQTAFFLHNAEGKSVSYSYTISAEGGQKAFGSIELQNSETKKIVEQVSFKSSYAEPQRVLVEIKSSERNEVYTLYFWVNVS